MAQKDGVSDLPTRDASVVLIPRDDRFVLVNFESLTCDKHTARLSIELDRVLLRMAQ